MGEDRSPSPLPYTLAGFLVGGLVGSSIGIAAFGSAISGTIPLGLLGGYVGYIYGPRFLGRKGGRTTDEIIADVKSGVKEIFHTIQRELERRKIVEEMALDELEAELWSQLQKVEGFLTNAKNGWVKLADESRHQLDDFYVQAVAKRAIEYAEELHMDGISAPDEVSWHLVRLAADTPTDKHQDVVAIAVLGMVNIVEAVVRISSKRLKANNRHIPLITDVRAHYRLLIEIFFGGSPPPIFQYLWPLSYHSHD